MTNTIAAAVILVQVDAANMLVPMVDPAQIAIASDGERGWHLANTGGDTLIVSHFPLQPPQGAGPGKPVVSMQEGKCGGPGVDLFAFAPNSSLSMLGVACQHTLWVCVLTPGKGSCASPQIKHFSWDSSNSQWDGGNLTGIHGDPTGGAILHQQPSKLDHCGVLGPPPHQGCGAAAGWGFYEAKKGYHGYWSTSEGLHCALGIHLVVATQSFDECLPVDLPAWISPLAQLRSPHASLLLLGSGLDLLPFKHECSFFKPNAGMKWVHRQPTQQLHYDLAAVPVH
eukprot:gene10799-1964_t